MACAFSTSQLSTSKSRPNMVWFCTFSLLHVLRTKNGVHLFATSAASKSASGTWHGFVHFPPLPNVLRTTTACTFSTSQRPKVLRARQCFDTFSRQNVLRATKACNFSSFIWPAGSAPAALASLLFNPLEPQNIRKNTVFRDFPTFSRTCIFSLLAFSELLPGSASSWLCFSSVHIVGSFTSKLPSAMMYGWETLAPTGSPLNREYMANLGTSNAPNGFLTTGKLRMLNLSVSFLYTSKKKRKNSEQIAWEFNCTGYFSPRIVVTKTLWLTIRRRGSNGKPLLASPNTLQKSKKFPKKSNVAIEKPQFMDLYLSVVRCKILYPATFDYPNIIKNEQFGATEPIFRSSLDLLGYPQGYLAQVIKWGTNKHPKFVVSSICVAKKQCWCPITLSYS